MAKTNSLRPLIAALRYELAQQEGIWSGIKSAADSAISAVPVVGKYYNGAVSAFKANKAVYHATQGAVQSVLGKKKAAAKSFQKAKTAGVDALGRGAAIAGGSAADSAVHAIAKPLVTKPTPGIVKRKPLLPAPIKNESKLFPTALSIVEFRSMAGLPITEEHKSELEAEEAAAAATK